MKEARNEHEEALKTFRELAQKNPETYLPPTLNGDSPAPEIGSLCVPASTSVSVGA